MDSKKIFLNRIRIIAFFVCMVGVLSLYKLFTLQIVRSEDFKEEADNSYVKSSSAFNRGTIFFQKRDGARISAATINNGYMLAINPSILQAGDILKTYEALNAIIPIEKEDFVSKASKENDPYEEVAYKISREDIAKISDLKIKGIIPVKYNWRFYPGSTMAAQTIGFLGYGKGTELSGQYGLEKSYGDTLDKQEKDLYVNIFAEIFSGIKQVISSDDKKEGDIVTTIEPTVQNFLEDELSLIMEKYNPESASGIILNPQNGEIVAMGHLPSFDLNNFQKVSSASIYSNPLVESSFEFGSVVKPLVIAIGIDTGVLSADTPFNDKGSVVVGNRTIYNYDKKARGQIDLQQVLSQSLNTGMVFSEQKIGKENFKKYMLNFKLGEKSGIDLPNEATGLVSNLMSGRDVEYANISFGQGISFSPIVLVRALSALGNGGYLVQPHIVKEIDYAGGVKKQIVYPKEKQPQILKPSTSEAISKMLVYSVDHVYGSGKYKMPNYSIAAKTGTAQIPDPKNGGYYTDRNLHSFIGYFPAYNPQFLILLSITAPRGVQYAAETLSQPFFDLTKFLISYYEVPPDR